MTCAHCHRPLDGRRRVYCDAACRKRAWRRRHAGLAEDALPTGRRGRVPLHRLTDGELQRGLGEIAATIGDSTQAIVEGMQLLRRTDTRASHRLLKRLANAQQELREEHRERFPST